MERDPFLQGTEKRFPIIFRPFLALSLQRKGSPGLSPEARLGPDCGPRQSLFPVLMLLSFHLKYPAIPSSTSAELLALKEMHKLAILILTNRNSLGRGCLSLLSFHKTLQMRCVVHRNVIYTTWAL